MRVLLACPPLLWLDLDDGLPLPSTLVAASWAIEQWSDVDADAALIPLPREYQAWVLALAPWRAADCAPSSPRMARLLTAGNGMAADEFVALATAHPWALAGVAAAARLAAREPAIAATSNLTTASIADTLTGMASNGGSAREMCGIVGRLLAAGARRRPEMALSRRRTTIRRGYGMRGSRRRGAALSWIMTHGARTRNGAREDSRAPLNGKEDDAWTGIFSFAPSTAPRRR